MLTQLLQDINRLLEAFLFCEHWPFKPPAIRVSTDATLLAEAGELMLNSPGQLQEQY
jgi:hypothetical protein